MNRLICDKHLTRVLAVAFVSAFLVASFGGISTVNGVFGSQFKTFSVQRDSTLGSMVGDEIGTQVAYGVATSEVSRSLDSQSSMNQTLVPGLGSDDASIGGVVWNSPTNVYSEDGQTAWTGDYTPPRWYSHYLKVTGFGFSIPLGATILGIQFQIKKWAKIPYGGDVEDWHLHLLKAGVIVGNDKADNSSQWSSLNTWYYYGDSDDLWGVPWTPIDVDNADFGAVFACTGYNVDYYSQGQVDMIRMEVWYQPGGPSAVFVDTWFGNLTWSDPDAVKLEDGVFANATRLPGNYSTYVLRTCGYGFSVPAAATITGIKVEIKCYATAGNTILEINQLWNASGAIGVNWNDIIPTVLWWMSYGGLNDSWGATLTPRDVNNATFGHALAFRIMIGEVHVDAVRMTVFYSTGSKGSTGGTSGPAIIDPTQISLIVSLGAGVSLTLLLGAILVNRKNHPSERIGTQTEEVARTPTPQNEESYARADVEAGTTFLGTCPSCGAATNPANSSYCSNCGVRLTASTRDALSRTERKRRDPASSACMICSLRVKPGEKVVRCPYCGHVAHETHMLAWLHVKDYCPACSKHLDSRSFS